VDPLCRVQIPVRALIVKVKSPDIIRLITISMGQIEIEQKNVDHALTVLNENDDVRAANKKLIFDFIEAAKSGKLKDGEKITLKRQYKYITVLKRLDMMLEKDFRKATKKDIEIVVDKINSMTVTRKHETFDASAWTKYTYKVILKRFYKWLKGGNDEYPDIVKWIHPKMTRQNNKPEGSLITMEDVKKMANKADNMRDRAFVLFLYESGARIGEIMTIRIKDFKPDEHGAKIDIPQGKTGPRTIRIIASSPAISNWISQHPMRLADNTNNSNILFCGISNYKRGQNIVYQNYRKILKQLADRAMIQKSVNPHFFRHSRASDLAKIVRSPAVLCQYMGWIQGSREAATYVHLDDTDNEILAAHGIKINTNKQDEFISIKCPRCHVENDPASQFCTACSLGLDERSMIEFDRRKEQLIKTGAATEDVLNDPNGLQFLIDKLNDRRDRLVSEKK
jgi:integrase/recombinase XerD